MNGWRTRRALRTTLLALAALIGSSLMAGETDESTEAEPTPGVRGAHLRVARPTDDLEAVVTFYRDGMGFEVLGSFEDHQGFDGVMLGHAGMGYHLELTHERGHKMGRAPNPEHLLIFYLPDPEVWQSMVDHLKRQGHEPVASNNPYWDRRGKTFEDPDGYRVVIARMAWE